MFKTYVSEFDVQEIELRVTKSYILSKGLMIDISFIQPYRLSLLPNGLVEGYLNDSLKASCYIAEVYSGYISKFLFLDAFY